jgi:hypothetical protein
MMRPCQLDQDAVDQIASDQTGLHPLLRPDIPPRKRAPPAQPQEDIERPQVQTKRTSKKRRQEESSTHGQADDAPGLSRKKSAQNKSSNRTDSQSETFLRRKSEAISKMQDMDFDAQHEMDASYSQQQAPDSWEQLVLLVVNRLELLVSILLILL